MNAFPDSQARGEVLTYHGAVSAFKRRLIETTLHQARGNRTHAARTLGLQRTYLLRLIRELQVAAPPPPSRNGRPPGEFRTMPAASADLGPGAAASPAPARTAETKPAVPRPAPPAFCSPARPPAHAPARRLPRR
jgi:hypothetical protein